MADSRKYRVLALAAEAYGGYGGIAQSTRDLIQALLSIPEICEVEVLPRLSREPSPETPEGVWQQAARPGKLAYAFQALKLALIRPPDVVYCGHAFMAPVALLVARLSGARLVSHVHGLEVWNPLSRTARHGLAASDLLLCVSQYTADKVIGILDVDPARCAIVYNTLDERFVPGDRFAARKRFGIKPSAVVLSTVSRLDSGQRHKGHDHVIPLLSDLAADIVGLVYLIAGTGDDRERLERLARDTGAADLVRFVGYVPAEDLPDLYRASDLYVMPSHGEGFGIAFVEAMASGTPALGLDEGGASEALRNGELGRAVDLTDFPAALATALASDQPGDAELAMRTRTFFGRNHFQARVAEAMSPVISKVTTKA